VIVKLLLLVLSSNECVVFHFAYKIYKMSVSASRFKLHITKYETKRNIVHCIS
jgi:hypothetical protein